MSRASEKAQVGQAPFSTAAERRLFGKVHLLFEIERAMEEMNG